MQRCRSSRIKPFLNRGTLFVVSAPSGAGKTTLCRELLRRIPGLRLSVSYTTRAPREGEINDVHYTFVSEKKFRGMIEKGEFAEWAVVHGNLYGTSSKRLKKLIKDGYDIILDIDVHGARQLKSTWDNAVYIFVLPPSMQILRKRLTGRKTESAERIKERLDNARAEIAGYRDYDYIIINDKLEKAYDELESIVISSKIRTANINPKWIAGFVK
ncbi:MAG: guanylate kinase [Deferribacteres bacterium]|nr:guanylate kinase [Deferribacteres bacterium]